MSYAPIIAEIESRRAALAWSKSKLARQAKLAPASVKHFIAGRLPEKTSHRDFMADELRKALAAAEKVPA